MSDSTDDFSQEPLREHCEDLLENAGWRPDSTRLRSLAFTSCRVGSGVTTLLVQSAKIAVDSEQRVLIVDCNSRGKRLHKMFGVDLSPGLCEVLDDLAQLESSICLTKQDGLSLLPAGKSKRVAVADSEVISELIDLLHREFDLVLFDMPPVEADGKINGWYRVLDATVLVVSAGDINLQEAQSAQTELIRAGANIRGIVLNKDNAS